MTFEERKAVFMEWLKVEYRGKMTELQCDMYSYPQWIPDGQGGFKLIIQTEVVDISNSPVKSTFQV